MGYEFKSWFSKNPNEGLEQLWHRAGVSLLPWKLVHVCTPYQLPTVFQMPSFLQPNSVTFAAVVYSC